jgi:hypothetical protein
VRRWLTRVIGGLGRGTRVGLLVGAAVIVSVVGAELGLRLVGLGHPILYDNRATYGYRPRPDQTRRRLFGARVHVNGLGLRGPDWNGDGLGVLFLGDSVTWGGSYVDDHDLFAAVALRTLAERLPGRLPPLVPLDAGVNGWGPQNVRALLDEDRGFGSPLWVLTLVDDDFRREKTRIGEVPYFNRPPATAFSELLVLGSYAVLTRFKEPKPPADLERIAAENLQACRDIFRLAGGVGARLLLVWHPTSAEVAGEPEVHKARLLQAAAADGVPVLDLTAAYEGERGLYVDGLHLSVTGHRVAGVAIGERLATMLADGGAGAAAQR